ncbi:PDZ domain-containing protein [Novipirellula sp. SH528]|uniref:PDZ domain-containing protein n=1 Tax=Novipirellula sp. SH528 TaxID=3454466 RepID=UPI003F9FCA02
MNVYRSKLFFHRVLATMVLLSLPLTFSLRLDGDEPKTGEAKNQASDVAESADPVLGELPIVEQTQQMSKDLTSLLRTLTDQQLVAIAKGDEPPPKISQNFGISSDQLNEELLAELARRWDRQLHPTTVAENAPETQPVVASNATVEDNAVINGPAKPDAVKLDSIVIEAFSGTPLNVGVMELTFTKGHGPILYPDQPLYLDATPLPAHYVTFDVSYQKRQGESPWQVDRIRVSFLHQGGGPAELTLSGVQGLQLDPQKVDVIENPGRHRELLQRWWQGFSTVPQELDPQQKMLKESLLDILARRLQLPGPWPRVEHKAPQESLSLESQFERAIGMLFGIESVKLAMQEDVTLNQSTRHEKANRPIPPRPRMRSIDIPSVPASTWIEPIAMHVPAECFYLRTGNLANYRYFREFLLSWGGSLDDIVATPSLDHQTREKIERQLGLNPEDVSAKSFDKLVSDMALIGCDPLFSDGAAVGILFRSRDARGLYELIQTQRNESKLRVPGSEERRVDIGAHAVSFLASDDNRLRSFYAIDGEYHLVTNSRYLLERFYDAGSGDRSLGSLPEFRYARSKTRTQNQTLAFLYLSDPFFQNLISPQYRIEVTRRKQAVQVLRQFQLARMVAKAERVDAESMDDLVKSQFLPTDFGRRPDDSYPRLDNGQITDSLRGSPGVFLPVPDVPIQKATQSEVSSYNAFIGRYRTEWKQVDPVTVVFAQDAAAANDLQRIRMDIIITPYAPTKYSFLQRHLAAADNRRVGHVDGDLLSVDTAIRLNPGQQSHRLYLGLRDDEVAFNFSNGRIEMVDQHVGTSYAKSRSYAAISPPSTGVLRLLASIMEQPQPALPQGQLPGVGHIFFALGRTIGNMAEKLDSVAKYRSNVTNRNGWMVASTNTKIQHDTPDQLAQEWINKPTQVRLQMGSLSGSKVEPYIQAYTYHASRKVSSENSRFLNDFAGWLQLPTEESRDALEGLLGAHIHCPLGGDYMVENSGEHPHWVSTSWSEASLYSLTKAPESWKFPFLDWIRRLDLRFDLDRTTLRAQVDLLVLQPSDPAKDGVLINLQMDDSVYNAANRMGMQSGFSPNHSTMNRASSNPSVVSPQLAVSPSLGPQSRPARIRTAVPEADARQAATQHDWILGVQVSTTDQSIRITHVYANSPASQVGIQVGDIIQTVDRQSPRSSTHLMSLINSASSKGTAEIKVDRGGFSVTFDVPLAAQ